MGVSSCDQPAEIWLVNGCLMPGAATFGMVPALRDVLSFLR